MELERRLIRKKCEASLIGFIEEFWDIVEPARPFVTGWALEAICAHLEAVAFGGITNLLMNVPPGFMKSLATDVFFPAWEWGPLRRPSMRYVSFSYSSSLTERDNGRFAKIVQSKRYQDLWGDIVTFAPHAPGATKVSNLQTGWKIASSVGGVGTGERGDRVVVDDAHNVKESESEPTRTETVRWFRESITTRLNDPEKSATIVIMQRVHEEDVSGVILDEENDYGYVHLCIPMHFDPGRAAPTYLNGDDPEADAPFWEDPRTEEGELAFPERFPAWVVKRDESRMGPSASAAQFEQSPHIKGGNIIDRIWWKLWPDDAEGKVDPSPPGSALQFPLTSLRVGSVDTAYGEKETNAYNAMTVWGVWWDRHERPKTVLMEAWRARLPLRGIIPPTAKTTDERRPHWGLVEKVLDTIRRRQLDIILIENKTRGGDLAAELRKLLRDGECQVLLIDPAGDKVSRLHAVQAMFADGMVYAPNRSWSEMTITEVAAFPRGKYADLTDTVSMALSWMRKSGALSMEVEADEDNLRRTTFRSQKPAAYDV